MLERGLRTKTTVALSRAEARELADLLATDAFGSNLALLQEALLLAQPMASSGPAMKQSETVTSMFRISISFFVSTTRIAGVSAQWRT